MGTLTYQYKLDAEHTISIKAKKEDAKHIGRSLADAGRAWSFVRELSGIRGESERGTTFMTIGSVNPVSDPEAYAIEAKAFFDSLPPLLTAESTQPFLAQARELLNKWTPVRDQRESRAERDEQDAVIKRLDAEREAKRMEWVDAHCRDRSTSMAPTGTMPIVLRQVFDDSDSRSDYFSPHSSIGEPMLLAFLPEGSQTQDAARTALARYPELAALDWKWETEKYSMGHGNYLWSTQSQGTVKHGAYDGRDEVAWRYEVQFGAWRDSLYAVKGYPGALPASVQADATACGPSGIIARRNQAHNGIEVKFPNRAASEAHRARLSWFRFRWSGRQALWYTRFSADAWEWAQSLNGTANGSEQAPSASTICESHAERFDNSDLGSSLFGDETGDLDTAHEDVCLDQTAQLIGA